MDSDNLFDKYIVKIQIINYLNGENDQNHQIYLFSAPKYKNEKITYDCINITIDFPINYKIEAVKQQQAVEPIELFKKIQSQMFEYSEKEKTCEHVKALITSFCQEYNFQFKIPNLSKSLDSKKIKKSLKTIDQTQRDKIKFIELLKKIFKLE